MREGSVRGEGLDRVRAGDVDVWIAMGRVMEGMLAMGYDGKG